ncbi:MAG: calcium/sodium antiporter [Chitinispirillia bacterium]|jgi:cation:H+ antiporter
MSIIFWSIVFIISLFTLIKSSDFFTGSAEKIGLFFGIPAFVVGATIVAFGTSLPELVTSILAVLSNSSEIVIGNVLGSNIANIFLVLGIAAIISKKIEIKHAIVHVDLPFLVGSTFLLAVTVWDKSFNLPEAILFIIGLFIYIQYSTEKSLKKGVNKGNEELHKKGQIPVLDILILVLSGVFIFFGAKYTIESVIRLSKILSIQKEIIAVSAVALGTSLPELAVTVVSAKKGKSEMALGNVIGSNLFNTFAVMGIPALIGPLVIPASIITFVLPMLIISVVLFYVICQDNEVTIWEGWLLILFYLVFSGKLFNIF